MRFIQGTYLRFNSLQVRYKQGPGMKKLEDVFSFNSLQVRYKLAGAAIIFSRICAFQFLIGTLQTSCSISHDTIVSPLFQFLIGTLQTQYGEAYTIIAKLVSIPYRYATNVEGAKQIIAEALGFNSLQVRYKRKPLEVVTPEGPQVSIPYRYATNDFLHLHLKFHPFLVSIPYRYATNPHIIISGQGVDTVFQFLIGTLQTGNFATASDKIFIVSIPYRYATNKENPGRSREGTVVSIPYRYATNNVYHLLID